MVRKQKKIEQNEDGSVVTEFALTLPIVLLMVFGIIEVGYYFFLSASIENAVLSASRFGVTGGVLSEDVDRETQIRDIILRQTFGSVNESDLTIETRVFEQFADIGREPEAFADANDNGQYDDGEIFSDVNGNGEYDDFLGEVGLGGTGAIVLYNVTYQGATLSGLDKLFSGGFTVKAAVAVRNEPFPTNTTAPVVGEN